MAWPPAGSAVLVVNVAVPVMSRATVAVSTPAMVKVTVPVGMPAPGATGATTAVTLNGCPYTDGSGVEVTVVVVADWATVWVVLLLDGPKVTSPP